MHLCPEFQKLIPGASSDGITLRLVQVITHALLNTFMQFFFILMVILFIYLGHLKLFILVHVEIGSFSAYRVGYTRKIP